MPPSRWLLAFIAALPDEPVDPVRLQKGLFLLAMRGVIPPAERYAFEPYAYGPMSRMLYRDLRALAADGLVEQVEVPWAEWSATVATDRGRAAASGVAVPPGVLSVRREVGDLSFPALLQRVYDEYPEFAVHSVFRR